MARGDIALGRFRGEIRGVEGPLLLVKAWALSALVIWVYQRWFQRVAPPSPAFEAFCRERPVVAAIYGLSGDEAAVRSALWACFGAKPRAVATLGTFPWPHYVLHLELEQRPGAVLLRVVRAEVRKSRGQPTPLLHGLRDALNHLSDSAEAWAHAGTFDNGLVSAPIGGFAVCKGGEKRPRLERLERAPRVVRASLGLGEPDATLLAARHRVNDSVPGVAR